MELIQIIKVSLGIFTFLTALTFIVSFVVYKIKNRNSIKPYERKPVLFDSSLILEVEDTPEENEIQNSFSKKFEILNENAPGNQTNTLIPIDSNHKFNKFENSSVAENFSSSSKPKTPRRSPNEVFNIYSFYSNNNSRPMHKLKVKALTAE